MLNKLKTIFRNPKPKQTEILLMFDDNAFLIMYKKLLALLESKRMEISVLMSGNRSLAARVKELEGMLSEVMALGNAELEKEDMGGSMGGDNRGTPVA
jgi:hypothetical protein